MTDEQPDLVLALQRSLEKHRPPRRRRLADVGQALEHIETELRNAADHDGHDADEAADRLMPLVVAGLERALVEDSTSTRRAA